ncbi:MAG: 30S ribosomal protein S6 [Parcubacteria group bacterium]
MKLYELTYLVPLDLPENEVKSLQERINSFIAESQGALDRIENVVKKKLGEPQKNQTMAQMGMLNFYMAPEKLADLEKKLKSENQIIHHMILYKKPRKAEIPRRIRQVTPIMAEDSAKTTEKPKKVEIKEIEKKLEEILGE